jgi:uncharacterized small protein (DUF1192 family)
MSLEEPNMDSDDLEPRQKKAKPKDLSAMSIEDLQDYISDLEGEIERAKEAIKKKQSARMGAESVFKS